jgi:GGDEF domain-containing protein
VTLLLVAAAVLVAGAVIWNAIASRNTNVGTSLPTSANPTIPGPSRAAGIASVPVAPSSLAVVAVAVDQFAAATGQLGDALVSEARAEVAGALRAAVRRQDLCTPWRDHLVIAVLPGVDLDQTAALRQRVRRALSEIRIVTHSGEELSIGFRVASACAPMDGTSEADLLDVAEKRLAQDHPAASVPADATNARLCAALPILSN